jgi:hypothetical protein
VHSQRLYELAKVSYQDYAAPSVVLRLLGYTVSPQPDSEIGLPFIHGVEPREKALYRPLQNFEGGTLLVGTTQAGKGVALGSFLTQAIRRGDVVVFIDPKNSRRLKRVVQRACSDYQDADTFLEFHPAFPEFGVRLDFTFNWQKPTEIASRVQSIMPEDTGGAFTAFGWDAVNVVVRGLVSLEDRPNLIKLTMLAILCIVLSIPSASPPERFTEVLRAEHAVTLDIWGPAVADRILRRMLDIQQGSPPLSEPPAPMVLVGQQPAVDAAMSAQMTQMSMRLFGNPYFRSIDSLFALATYRLSAIIDLLSLLTIFLLVVAVDGFGLRQVRAKEFVAHSEEMFGGSLIAAIILGGMVAVAAFLPMRLHPMFFTLSLLAMFFALSRAIANHHVIR